MALVAATERLLADDRHVRAGAYLLDVDGKLYAVLDRRLNTVGGPRAEALVEDVSTPTRARRYITNAESARLRRTVRLESGNVVDADAETTCAWVPVIELVGCELVRPPAGMGVTAFPRP